MKIGDQVRFLSDTGGGKVAGFQGKDIVLVEDEDGFQIPTSIRDVVVVTTDDYSMGKMMSEKLAAREAAEAKAQTELKDDSKSMKARLNEGIDDSGEEPEEEPSDREVTFSQPVEERKGGNRLSVYLALVPEAVPVSPDTKFEVCLVNDSNYFIQYACLRAEGQAWTLQGQGELEPNTKFELDTSDLSGLSTLGRIGIQVMAYKKDKSFLWKPVVEAQFRIDALKLLKPGVLKENDFFDQPALFYPVVENDVVSRPSVLDAETLKKSLYRKEQADLHLDRLHAVSPAPKKEPEMLVTDLHASALLDTTAGMNAADILHYQIDQFRKVMDAHLDNKGQKLIFIHGKGEGVLRSALLHELRYRYKHCIWQDASFREYGYGATQVTIR